MSGLLLLGSSLPGICWAPTGRAPFGGPEIPQWFDEYRRVGHSLIFGVGKLILDDLGLVEGKHQ